MVVIKGRFCRYNLHWSSYQFLSTATLVRCGWKNCPSIEESLVYFLSPSRVLWRYLHIYSETPLVKKSISQEPSLNILICYWTCILMIQIISFIDFGEFVLMYVWPKMDAISWGSSPREDIHARDWDPFLLVSFFLSKRHKTAKNFYFQKFPL